MEITEIYQKYKIPKTMQDHMIWSAAVVKVLVDNWTGTEINKELMIKAMLLHDLGNVAKLDLANTKLNASNGENLEYWAKVKQDFIAKYGENDHEATKKIVREIGGSEDLIWLIDNKLFKKNPEILAGNSWEAKICAYADQRVAPTGVMTLRDRLDEVAERYKNKPGAYINKPEAKAYFDAAYEIEKQVLSYTKFQEDKFQGAIEEVTGTDINE